MTKMSSWLILFLATWCMCNTCMAQYMLWCSVSLFIVLSHDDNHIEMAECIAKQSVLDDSLETVLFHITCTGHQNVIFDQSHCTSKKIAAWLLENYKRSNITAISDDLSAEWPYLFWIVGSYPIFRTGDAKCFTFDTWQVLV